MTMRRVTKKDAFINLCIKLANIIRWTSMAMVGHETCNREWIDNWQQNGAALSMEDNGGKWSRTGEEKKRG